MTTRNQHYVWRYYLEAWQGKDGLVRCSRKGKLLPPTKPKNIMVERDFYKLSQITRSDADFLTAFIESTGSAPIIQTHRNLVAAFAHIANANQLIQNSDRVSAADKRLAKAIVIETEEKLQQHVEHDAIPLLKELRQKQTEFINTYETAITFFHFIAQQYFRTRRIREAIGRELAHAFSIHDFSRLKHIVSYIGAVNVGGSLFVDRSEFDILFLENRNGVGFITGDQPVVNLLGTGDSSETTELAFYYPLSPSLSCVIAPKDLKLRSTDIPIGTVEDLNDLMAWEAADFLVAETGGVLQHILSKRLLARPPGCRIIESIVKIQV